MTLDITSVRAPKVVASNDAAMQKMILERLIRPTWPPWFTHIFNPDMMQGMSKIFPEGQIVITSQGMPVASLNTNRISWDGNPQNLPSWDMMIGSLGNFQKAYGDGKGNTLVMLNINVDEGYKGENLPHKMISAAIDYAKSEGITRLMGAFRPDGHGKYKMEEFREKGSYGSFEEYCALKRPQDGLPQDAWLRNLTRNGMVPITIGRDTTVITVTFEEFDDYTRTYRTELGWEKVAPSTYECGQNGTWHAEGRKGTATYKESRLFGTVWSADSHSD